MTVLLVAHSNFPKNWREAFEQAFSHEGLVLWPNVRDLDSIDCAVIARSEPGVLAKLPNVRLISSTGMGVDHILSMPDLPRDVPIARVVTSEMVDQVAEYVTLAVLRIERDSDRFDRLQREAKWERRMSGRPQGRLRVGLLGWGIISREIARRLTFLGFQVRAWARTPRIDQDIVVHAGPAGLDDVLAASNILISALPITSDTINLVDSKLMKQLPVGAHLINVGRGEHVVDDDLLSAIDGGHLSSATLDVFRSEPLPPDHPFWRHDKIRVTPHSAGMLTPGDSAAAILENLKRVRSGQRPKNQINIELGF